MEVDESFELFMGFWRVLAVFGHLSLLDLFTESLMGFLMRILIVIFRAF